ncbi:hypothetical protein F4604DRAFT_1682417 [Suillus subluteus]|nr:hypothetical protein F4604DRAFT_1682417 [Suillus subluteus]
MALSASRHGSLPLSMPLLYSNVTQSAGQSGDWMPLTPSTNPKLSLVFDQQPLQLQELRKDIFKPSPTIDLELPDPDQLILLGDKLKTALIKTLAFDGDQAHEGLNIVSDLMVVLFRALSVTNNWLPDEESSQQVPDIMGVVHCIDQLSNNKSFVLWLVEAGFSQSDVSIMYKFGHMVKNNSDIKTLIRMNREKFKSLILPKTSDMMYGPVVVGGHNWLKLKTLIPKVDMTKVDCLLNRSAANLKAEIISIMEGFGLEQSIIDKACNSKPELPLNWSTAAMQMSSTVCDTVYFHYIDWYNYKHSNKCKGGSTNNTAHTTEVSAAPLASGSTEHDLKKPKVSKEQETNNASSKKKKKRGYFSASVKTKKESEVQFGHLCYFVYLWNPIGHHALSLLLILADLELKALIAFNGLQFATRMIWSTMMKKQDVENDFPIPNGEALGGGAAGGIVHILKDWELTSFLLCLMLSMAAIDYFLGIELISQEFKSLTDQSLTTLLSHSKRATGSC